MEATPTPSVIAKLMGLDDSPPQAPVQKQRRVLSENYLRRVASIGARESRHSFRLRVPEVTDYGGSFLIGEHLHNPQVSPSTCTSGSGNVSPLTSFPCKLQNATLLETFENGIVTESLGEVGLVNLDDFSRSQLGSNKEERIPVSRIVVKPKHGKAENSARCFPSLSSFDVSHSSDRKSAHETGSRTLDHKLFRHHRSKRQLVRVDLKDLDLSKFRTQQDKYAALCNEWSFKPKGSINLGQHKSMKYKFNQNDGFGPVKLRSNRKKLQSYPSLGLKGVQTMEKTPGNFKKWQSGRRTCNFVDKNDDSSSHGTDTSVQQETSTECYKESPFLLHCSTAESDSMTSLEEAYQPSPVSVLEPLYSGERSATPEFLQSMSVDITDYSDAYSEGYGMIVSSDDGCDTNEGSASSYRENEDSMRLFRVEESRDYSYLVDVLSEIGFYVRNSVMDLDTWCLPEWPVSISVFETLEKKFGGQASWKRSDRRLLFDRINAGLMEIFEPCLGVPVWTKPVSRRIRSTSSEEMIEEDLWMLLVSQEKETGKDSTKKVLGREIELDLGDDIDGIGREIERFLFDKLVAEFVSLESL